MTMNEDTGILMGGPPGFPFALKVDDARDYRTLLSVDAQGSITYPDDLTLDEAKSVIEQLVPLARSRAARPGEDRG